LLWGRASVSVAGSMMHPEFESDPILRSHHQAVTPLIISLPHISLPSPDDHPFYAAFSAQMTQLERFEEKLKRKKTQ